MKRTWLNNFRGAAVMEGWGVAAAYPSRLLCWVDGRESLRLTSLSQVMSVLYACM